MIFGRDEGQILHYYNNNTISYELIRYCHASMLLGTAMVSDSVHADMWWCVGDLVAR